MHPIERANEAEFLCIGDLPDSSISREAWMNQSSRLT
jgi:hypothetical protein